MSNGSHKSSFNGAIKTNPSQDNGGVQWDIKQISRAIICFQNSGSWATSDLDASTLTQATVAEWLEAMRHKYGNDIMESLWQLKNEDRNNIRKVSIQLKVFIDIVKKILDDANRESEFLRYYCQVIIALQNILEE